jgi:hypothetical protein
MEHLNIVRYPKFAISNVATTCLLTCLGGKIRREKPKPVTGVIGHVIEQYIMYMY